MTVEISLKTKKDILDAMKLHGYGDVKEFVEDALRRRVLDLKKTDFLKKTAVIKKELTKKGIAEESVLGDFDKFYHQK